MKSETVEGPAVEVKEKVYYDFTITTTDGLMTVVRAHSYYTTEPWSVFVSDDEWTNVQTVLIKTIHCIKSAQQ